MKIYKVTASYGCDGSECVSLEYVVKARSEDQAFARAMVKHRREFLGGDVYRLLKDSKAHRRNEFRWKNYDGGQCVILFDGIEEIHGRP